MIHMVLDSLRKGGRTAETVKYSIVSQLACHSDCKVWLAEHNSLKVKRIIKGILKKSRFHDRLIKEAHLLKNLNHPNIPKIYDLDEDDEYTYIIEEYIEGGSLKSLCGKRLLSEKEIIHFMLQFSNIISYLHSLPKSLLYLDIKPENIIIHNGSCFLIDFGSAAEEGDDTGPIFGTLLYSAPEQSEGGHISKAADIYSLGRLLEYMLANGSVSKKTEKALKAVVGRCTSRLPVRRFGSVGQLTVRLKEIDRQAGSFSKKPLKITFAGAVPNAGTTYIALLFSAYVKCMGRACVYLEMNRSEAWYAMTALKNNDRALAGLEILSRKFSENRDLPDCDVIYDYGTLKEDMAGEFYEADFTFIVTGNRCWEQDEIKRSRALSRRCKNKLFLVNLTQNVDDTIASVLEPGSYLAVPYIAKTSDIFKDTEVKSVLDEMMVRAGCYDLRTS